MRLPLLTLILGMVGGFAAHLFVVEHPQWYSVFTPSPKLVARQHPPTSTGPEKPRAYMPVEKVLGRLHKNFEDAVVVVLVEESYNDSRHLILDSVIEVWKGPAALAGKSMNSSLQPPLANHHSLSKERALKFMFMTPHVDSIGWVMFNGESLRMNPALTVESLRKELCGPERVAEAHIASLP